MTDLISRADAVSTVIRWASGEGGDIIEQLESLPSASVKEEPTVIRSRTHMPAKDYKELVKRIKEAYGVIVLPCDAEAVSREAILSAKFHPLPYTHATPKDVEVESYKRGWNDALDAVADNAPSAEAVQGEWIPCSERLPEERGEYLISFHTNFLGDCIDIVRYGKPLMPNDEDYKQRNCFYGTSYDGFDVVCRDVTAWMPLPKPYEGSESDEID